MEDQEAKFYQFFIEYNQIPTKEEMQADSAFVPNQTLKNKKKEKRNSKVLKISSI